MTKVAIVILNWNGKQHLEKFLPFVLGNNMQGTEIYVADNASTDNSIAFVKENYPEIKIIQNSTNEGFAKGYNDALKHVNAQYYILLNSDVEVTPNWIKPIIDLMDGDEKIAACQPKIKSFTNKEYFEHAGAAGGFIDSFGYAFCRGRIFDTTEKDIGQYEDIREIFWATGACMFIRAKCFINAGGFDADFFAHMEEIDLCWRLKNQGYKIYYTPYSTVYHLGGGTLDYKSPRKTFLNFRNSLYMLYKNLSSFKLIPLLCFRLVLDGIAGLKFLFEGKFSHFLAVIKAHLSFYANVKKLRKKRMKEFKNQDFQGFYKGSIIVDYYLKQKKKFSEIYK
ncbi:MAG: glycosyltransferase family 2 protein [Bacteroidetes bacterium]|nr:glycosyltransferase family 2 protein [Bacteroidota bacterium]HET6244059.1 glycosyltransferase family 2 protein [Bacteroidia bacterium]